MNTHSHNTEAETMRRALRKQLAEMDSPNTTDHYMTVRQAPYSIPANDSQSAGIYGPETAAEHYIRETAEALAELEQEIFLGSKAYMR